MVSSQEALVTVPDAPVMGVATAGVGSATVSFTAPTNNGGSSITSYTVTAHPGNIIASGSSSPVTVTGLTSGQSYTFTVKATNAVGDSVASSASNAVTIPTAPDAPTNLMATVSTGGVDLTWSAPALNGGRQSLITR